MKTLLVLFSILLSISTINAQTSNDSIKKDNNDEIKTLINKKISQGGYIGINTGFSQVNDENAIHVGGRVAWVIGHGFAIGFAGNGFCNSIYLDDYFNSDETKLTGGYGGLLLEPIILPKSPVHISFPVVIGMGGIYNENNINWDFEPQKTDVFLIVEPGVELEFNLVKYIRLGAGITYRYAYDINYENLDNDVLNGLTCGLTLKFGKF